MNSEETDYWVYQEEQIRLEPELSQGYEEQEYEE